MDDLKANYKPLILQEGTHKSADFDEFPLASESPIHYVQRVSQLKADAGWKHIKEAKLALAPVLTADTTVAFDDEILGKPQSIEDAKNMLQKLSGREHKVLSAITMRYDTTVKQETSITTVYMRNIKEDEIARYASTQQPYDKAGGYGIQGVASIFIHKIEGSYSGVVGLPLYELNEVLRKFNISLL